MTGSGTTFAIPVHHVVVDRPTARARRALAKGVMFDVWLDYDETLKTAFDPSVEHVNASWRIGLGVLTP
jgi:hypothetical protein